MLVDLSTYEDSVDEYGDEYNMGGWVKVSCDCGFSGYVDVDDDGAKLYGQCEVCTNSFSVWM